MPLPTPQEVLGGGNTIPPPDEVLGTPDVSIDNTELNKQKVAFENAAQIIDNIPNISGYQKNLIKDLTQKGAKPEQLSEAIQGFQKQNEKDIHVWSDKPRASYGEYAYNKLAAGSAKLGSILAKTPAMIYDIAAQPFNYVASGRMMNDLTPVPITGELAETIGLNESPFKSADVAAQLGIKENKVAKYYDEDVKKRQEVTATRYDKTIEDYIANGEYSKALGATTGAVLESAPTTIALMMGNAAGVGAVGSTLGGGVGFAADKKAELDENAPHLSEQEKMNVALANGLFEGLFEQFGITKLGSITKDVLLRSGKEEAKKIALDGFKNVYVEPLKKYLGTSLAEESLSEAATQFAQNAVDIYSGYTPDKDLMEGVVDAAIVGMTAGGTMGAVPAKLEVNANKRANKYAEIIQQEDKVAKENVKSEHAFHVANQGEETVLAFESNVDNAMANGNLTLEEGEKAKHRVRAYQEYVGQLADVKLDSETKRKIADLSYQKQGLQTEVPEDIVEKDLSPIELGKRNVKQKQIKDLQKDIDNLMLGANEEIVTASKTEKDIAKLKEEGLLNKLPVTDKEKEISKRVESYKEETGYLPKDEVNRRLKANELPKMSEVDPAQFNQEKSKGQLGYNHRVKFKQVSEHIDALPEGKEKGVLKVVERPFKNSEGKWVKVKVIETEMPSGHRIRMSSSMAREGTDLLGHFREENLPRGTSDKIAYDLIEDFPIGMKIVKTTAGVGGEQTAIKVFNAKTGKIVGWAKATTKGEDALHQPIISADEKFNGKKGITKQEREGELKRREDLLREETVIEPTDDNKLPPTDTNPADKTPPVKPVVPTKMQPKVEKEVKQDNGKTTKTNASDGEGTVIPTDKGDNGQSDKKSGGEEKTARKERTKNLKVKSPTRIKALNIETFDPYGIVMQYFIGGGQLNSEAFKALYKNPKGESKGRANYIKPTSKVTVDGLAHNLMESNSQVSEDTAVWKDAVEEVLNEQPASLISMAENLIEKYREKEQIAPLTDEEQILEDSLREAEDKDVIEEVEDSVEKLEQYPNNVITNEADVDIILREDLDKDLFQKQKSYKGNIDVEHHERILKVAKHIQKVLPKVKVQYNRKLMAAGRLKGNVLEINPYYATADTPIHEAAHVLLDAVGHDNKAVQAALKQIKASPKGQKMWEAIQKDYAELSLEGQENELLAEAIGLEGKGIFDTEVEKGKFRIFLDYIFDWFKRKFGLEKNIAKSLARQIIGGRGLKNLTGKGTEEKLQKPTKEFKRTEEDEVQSLSDFRQDQWGRDIEKENEDIEYANEVIKDTNSTEQEVKEAKGLKEHILNRIREDKKHYLEYKNTVQTTDDLLSEDDLSDFTKEELIEAYWNASYYMDNNSPLFKAAQTRIAIALENEQIKELQKTNPNFTKENTSNNDISPVFRFFNALSDAPEKYPALQSLAKALDAAYSDKRTEDNELKSKHEKLAKSVIKEKNKKLGIVKGDLVGLFSSDSAKYFDYVDNGKGQVLTKEEAEAKGLSKAQTEYLDFFRELNDKRNAAYDENDELIKNDIIKIDPKFKEQWKQGGFISALNAYLTGATDLETEIEVSDPKTKAKLKKAYGEVQQELVKGKGSLPSKIIKAYSIAFKARKSADAKLKQSSINYRGALTLKSDKPRPKDRGYSKDFYAAANNLIDNYTHVKYMSPLIPLFDSVQQLYKKTVGNDSNLTEYIESEMQDKIYQNQGVGKLGVQVDAVAKFFRKWGSLRTMAFNLPANAVNVFIGNYSNWRKEGGYLVVKGNKRMFIGKRSTKKAGETIISKKALDVLEQFNVVQPDFDSNPQMKLGGWFNRLAYLFNQMGEYQISGSMFLGHMTKDEWNSFELKDGKYQLKEGIDKKAFTEKMQSYRDKVSSVQGKYDEKDRVGFMRTELGKALSQYKTWMPSWFKSRFGKEFINKYGEKQIGSVRSGLIETGKLFKLSTWTKEGISELSDNIKKGLEFDKENGRLKNREFAANLNGAIFVAAIYLAIHSGDDDKKKKKKKYYDTLSLENAMGNLLFIYDLEQAQYLIEHPVAIQGIIVDFIKALNTALHGDFKGAKKAAAKVIPYGKAYSTYDKYIAKDKK